MTQFRLKITPEMYFLVYLFLNQSKTKMFYRTILTKLEAWAEKKDRKPLILRGARQVGKTTLVELFSMQYDTYLYLNLELQADKDVFEKLSTIEDIIDAIYFIKEKKKDNGKTLLFIDEVQNSQKAISWLRYFYEKAKHIHVIAAGSLLEPLIGTHINFPVGRVEYMPVRPFSFYEFLRAQSVEPLLGALSQVPVPEYAHEKLLKSFREYTLIGGMPEVVKSYVENKDIVSLASIYDGLLTSYKEDIEKHSSSTVSRLILRHIMDNMFSEVCRRIKYQNFANSNYRSREVKEAFNLLEKTLIMRLIFPVVSTGLPLKIDYKKSPKLQLLDTGLINYAAGLQKEVFGSLALLDVYEGKIAEHIVGQELQTLQDNLTHNYHFWTKDKDSSAEVDYVYPYNGSLIPIEVKAGKSGRLRSLHEFIDHVSHNLAVRIYGGNLSVDKTKTVAGKEFYLLNLPFYLTAKLPEYLGWFENKYKTLA